VNWLTESNKRLRNWRKGRRKPRSARDNRSRLSLESLERRVMLASDLQITEFMAVNDATLATQEGAFPDWIEIYNAGTATVDLANWALTDDPADLSQWQFPARDLDADEYLVVFASDKDVAVADADAELHTNFKLSSSGEYLALVDPFGTIAFEYTPVYPPQTSDVSFGIGSDLAQYYFSDPTPGELNNTPQTSAPVFSQTGGSITSAFTLHASATSPAAIVRYTTDRSLPTETSPILPVGGLSISATTQLRVRAYETGFSPSEVVTETYIMANGQLNSVSSDLPIVVIEDFGGGDPDRETVLPAYMAFFEPDVTTGRASLDQPAALDTRIGIKARGNTSYLSQPKHSYRIEAWSDGADDDCDIQPVDMAPESDWILYGPMDWDHTMLRSTTMYELSRQMGYFAVDTQFVEVYFDFNSDRALDLSVTGNDYRGLYALMETPKFDENRIDMEELSDEGEAVGGAFVVQYSQRSYSDKYSVPGLFGGRVYVEVPSLDNLSQAEKNYVGSTLGAFSAAEINVQAWIDYHIPVAFAKDPDGFNLSTFYIVDENGVVAPGPQWDFDRTMGCNEDGDTRSEGTETWRYGNANRVFEEGWWNRLFDDAAFRQAYVDRWAEVREDFLNEENLFAIIYRQATEIAEAQVRDYRQWRPGESATHYAD